MTLKEQEKLFLSAILSTLDIRGVQKVVTEYNRLKDLPKLKTDIEKLCPKPFKHSTPEEMEESIKSSADYLERKEEKKEE